MSPNLRLVLPAQKNKGSRLKDIARGRLSAESIGFLLWILAAAALATVPLPSARAQATGQLVKIPLTIDYLALSAALKQQLYTDNGRAPLWNGADQCQYFYAENPAFSRAGDKVKLETSGTLSIGVAMGSQCISPIEWNGIIEAETSPYIDPNLNLKLRVTDINLYDQQHQKTLIAGKGFDLVKQYFIPRLEAFSFDLNPARQQLVELAQDAAPADVAERVKRTLATMRAEPQLVAADQGVRATLELTMPAIPAVTAAPPPAQLTPEEVAAFEKQLDQWDAFLVFAIKQVGELDRQPQLRDQLLDLLLDSRHRLVDALSNPQSTGPDPVRVLFLREWQRLGEIIRNAVRSGMIGDRALEFLSFISAGDALFALDQAAPALGMRISADDLRRLAKIMAPRVTSDPLNFNFQEDPTLRSLFQVKQPLSSEGPLETGPSVVETPGPSATPAEPAPTPAMSPQPEGSPISWLSLPRFLIEPGSAYGAQSAPVNIDLAARLQKLGKKLRRAVVGDDNQNEYRSNVDHLLEYTARREIGQEDIEPQYHGLYLRLAKAVAWQESCWRQFVLKRNRVVFLESSTHDLGLMQVNKYVWRGFYSIPRLEWDVLYNASAGDEILARLMQGTAGKRGAFAPGQTDQLARSVYAAYNGGPDSYRRWRGRESRQQRAIDSAFWDKFSAVSRGQQIDILSCAAEWGKTPGH